MKTGIFIKYIITDFIYYFRLSIYYFRYPHLDISSVRQPSHVSVLRDLVLELERETRANLSLVPPVQYGGGYPSERPVYQCEQGHLACHHCRHQHCTTCGDLVTTRAHGAQELIQQFC